ncbi:Cytochrome P450, E-class, group I [Ostreococcus tauri]|uniref:Cytochrome P450 n=1 Tax=Ostreococcus tauri TaxID=70448 RepID=A0A090MEN4_OSTTA|nr:Cytochrome P450, E-class, group I [Ostreococcus tauri]OUS46912.1 cytochrome P450 [Ostreococcus tauri]CEG01432.1 Cytochrome P450, E-class, group I [Ostreococcus tauri]|eukprot:XP_003080725.2 Cytochrome P450, E-class, group I [Ostreococcus tauri]
MALDLARVTLAVLVVVLALRVADAVVIARVVRATKKIAHWARREIILALGGAARAERFVPVLGHTVALFKAVGRYPCTWDLFATWGTTAAPRPARVQIFQRHCVVVADPELVKRVMQTNLKNYKKDTEFSYEPFLEILGTGLVTSEGETWRAQRQRISSALRIEILDDIIAIATRAVNRLSDKLEKVRGKGEAVELAEEFRLLTLQVIAEAILSLTPEQSDEVMPNLYLPIMDECNRRSLEPWRKFLPTREWREHRKRVAALNKYIVDLIRVRWKKRVSGETNPNPDILDRVLASVEMEEYGSDVEEQMCFEIKTFLLAGHETSAAMLVWTIYELVKNEDKMTEAVAEANKVLGAVKPGNLPTRDELAHLDYCVSALKETLRLYSVVPVVTRRAVEDDVLGGCKIPKGTTVIISLQGIHHREDLWPNAMSFEPERFLNGKGDEIGNYAYLPFIQGPRNCLGQYLALLEARVVLATLIRRFKFKSASANNGKKHTKAIPIAPADGMWFTVE